MFEYAPGDLLDRHGTLLNRSDCTETNERIFGEISGQSRRMSAMMEDLLALAKVGSLPDPGNSVDSDLVVRETLMELEAQFPGARGIIRLDPLPDVRIPATLRVEIGDGGTA